MDRFWCALLMHHIERFSPCRRCNQCETVVSSRQTKPWIHFERRNSYRKYAILLRQCSGDPTTLLQRHMLDKRKTNEKKDLIEIFLVKIVTHACIWKFTISFALRSLKSSWNNSYQIVHCTVAAHTQRIFLLIWLIKKWFTFFLLFFCEFHSKPGTVVFKVSRLDLLTVLYTITFLNLFYVCYDKLPFHDKKNYSFQMIKGKYIRNLSYNAALEWADAYGTKWIFEGANIIFRAFFILRRELWLTGAKFQKRCS